MQKIPVKLHQPSVPEKTERIDNSWSGLWRWTRWRDLGWEVHGKELIIFVVRDLTDSLLCVFPCSNNSCLCLSVDRWQVMMVFPSLFLIVYRVLSRIYHLGEKSWVAKGDKPPRGAFWDTILRNVIVCALTSTSSRLDDFLDIVTYIL